MSEKSMSSRIGDVHHDHRGKSVRVDLELGGLYWVVNLAEEGIQARLEKFKEMVAKGEMRESELAVNVGSFKADLEELVKCVERGRIIKPRRSKK